MDRPMLFELTARLFYGDKAYQIAGQEANPAHRRQWLAKIAKTIIKRLDAVETSPRHKQLLMGEAERFHDEARSAKGDPWDLVYSLVRICGRLLGYDFVRGARVHTLAYWQNKDQYYTTSILSGADALQDYYDRLNTISVRQRVIAFLKAEGLDDFKIALAMNTTEYEIKKLRRGNPERQSRANE
ncbi:MAG: hypothetical protein ACYDA8_13505 [Deferrisomatales bacterium]